MAITLLLTHQALLVAALFGVVVVKVVGITAQQQMGNMAAVVAVVEKLIPMVQMVVRA